MHVWCESERTSFSIMFFLLKNLVVCSACVFSFIQSAVWLEFIGSFCLFLFPRCLLIFFRLFICISFWRVVSPFDVVCIIYPICRVVCYTSSIIVMLLLPVIVVRLFKKSSSIQFRWRVVLWPFCVSLFPSHDSVSRGNKLLLLWVAAVFHFIYYVIIMIELTGGQRNMNDCCFGIISSTCHAAIDLFLLLLLLIPLLPLLFVLFVRLTGPHIFRW